MSRGRKETRLYRLLAIDLYCGIGGWADGFLTEGYNVIGFDIEARPYPGHLVLQDVLTLHGKQFKNATVIVASPPCQAYSYRAMPWKRAKALPPPDNSLFEACFRIQKEACEAADRYIPLIVENVCGAQKWVGRAVWHYGSYYLWGDVPCLMPVAGNMLYKSNAGTHDLTKRKRFIREGTKGGGGDWFHENKLSLMRQGSSKSKARKQASALIAKIPFPLAQHIARVMKINKYQTNGDGDGDG